MPSKQGTETAEEKAVTVKVEKAVTVKVEVNDEHTEMARSESPQDGSADTITRPSRRKRTADQEKVWASGIIIL